MAKHMRGGQTSSRPGTRGNFFAVDRRSWGQVCSVGLNAAVAYLVLARFSGRDNRTTAASVQAIESYTGISRGRARSALVALIDAKLLKQTEQGNRPRYYIVPHQAGKKGTQESEDKSDWTWLPNEFVSAVAGEPPPVERLRQTQDVMALRLAVDLYHAQNLREDGGVSRRHMYQVYERVQVGQQGPFTVWGFRKPTTYVKWTDLTRPHQRQHLSNEDLAAGKNKGCDFFARLNLLECLGLIEWIPYLVEGESDDAELIHPYDGDLGDLAHKAASRMLTDGQRERATDQELTLAPVPHHIAQVMMFGVARLRYRPKTSATAAWWADYSVKCLEYRARYNSMLGVETPNAKTTGNLQHQGSIKGLSR